MNTDKLSCSAVAQIEAICNEYDNKEGELINILKDTQSHLGYLPLQAQRLIASHLQIPAQRVYGVVSFYAFFSMSPKGKYPISVCLGTACYVRGAEKLLDEFKRILGIEVGETTADGLFSLDCLRCVGACGLAPVVAIGKKVYGRLQPSEIRKILKNLEEEEKK